MHGYVKLANFTAKPRFENLVACSAAVSGERVKLYTGKTGGGTWRVFFMNFSPALYYLNAWNRVKILPSVKLFSDLRSPSSTPSNFHSLICLMSLLGVKKNYSGVTNRPLQAKKVVRKGEKRR